LTVLVFSATPPADSNADANHIIQVALQPSPLEANLRRLTDEVGGRVPGTLAMQHAVQWGMQAFTAAGADSVHAASFEFAKTWADLFAEYANAPPIVDRAVKAKAKAIAFMATREHDILYRHTNSGAGEVDKIPMVIVAREDGERMARLLANKNLVWADLSIPNQLGGPIKSSNVIAELRGTEKPDEFVV